jgi:hypothetical protein
LEWNSNKHKRASNPPQMCFYLITFWCENLPQIITCGTFIYLINSGPRFW